MSLQIWLSGNNTMTNQGLLGDLIQTTAPTYVDGKFGKSMSSGGYKMSAEQTAQVLNNEAVSFCFWVYINADEGTTDNRVMFFGTNSMVENNNRKFSLYNYPTVNDLHWSWMNDTARNTFTAGVLSGVLPSYQWTHVAVTYQNPNGSVYINGEKVYSFTGISDSSTFAYETQVIYNSSYLRWNDYRIYNHCLSPFEIKQISQGLVTHFKLSGVGGANLLRSSAIVNRGCSSFSYDINTNQYNGIAPIGSGTWGYGITFSRNSSLGEITVPKGQTLCFSMEVNPDVQCTWNADVNNAAADGTSTGGNDNDNTSKRTKSGSILLANTWNKINWTYTAKTDVSYDLVDANSNFGIVTTDLTEPVSFSLRNVKIEYGTTPTPWCPNSADTLYSTLGYDDGIEYDCSGFGNDGAKNGTIAWSGDSPRYTGSYKFNGMDYIKTNFSATMSELSCSFWIKTDSNNGGYAIVASNYNNPSSGFWIATNCEGSGLWFYNGKYVKGNSNLSNDTWYHCCFTYNYGIGKWYKNGELVTTSDISSRGTFLTISNLTIGNSYTGTVWNTKFYGNISDFRLYSTCLSDSNVKSLYEVSASVDKTGNLFGREFVEEG